MAVSVINLGTDIGVSLINGLGVTQDGQYLFGASGNGDLYRWDISDNALESATIWSSSVPHLNDCACDDSSIYVLSFGQEIYKSSLSSPSFSLLTAAVSGDVMFPMTYRNDKLYVAGYHDTGSNYIARVWEVNTTTGVKTVVTEMDVTLVWGSDSFAYSDIMVASDGAIWGVIPGDDGGGQSHRIRRGVQGSSVPSVGIVVPELLSFHGQILSASTDGNMYYFNAAGTTQIVIAPDGSQSSITLSSSIFLLGTLGAAITNDITTCRVLGWSDVNASQLHAWKIFDSEQMFSLARASGRHSLLTYPCTFGDAKTAFHYGTGLFPEDEVVFSSPNPYDKNWSTQLGGSNQIMTVYSSGGESWAQVITVDTDGSIDYGNPRELDEVVGDITEAWMASYQPGVGLLAYSDGDGYLTVMVLRVTGDSIDSVASFHSPYKAHRLSATIVGNTLFVAAIDDLDSGNYPVYVVPIVITNGAGGLTNLDAAQEADFENWMISQGFTFENGYNVDEDFNGQDYDYRGYWLEFGSVDIGSGQHLTDTYKLPTHETFSDESRYASGQFAQYAGFWSGINHDIYNAPDTPYTGTYAQAVAALGTHVDFGDQVDVGNSSLGYTFAPAIASLGANRFIVRWPANTADSRFRHGVWDGASIALSPNAYTFSFDSRDFFLLGVGRTRAINGSLEAGTLAVRVIDINTTNNQVTTDTPFHTETSQIPADDVALASRATTNTMLMGWHLTVGIRVCHIQFPNSSDIDPGAGEIRIFQRNLK